MPNEAVTFGLVPVHDDVPTRMALGKIGGALGEALGRRVLCHCADSPASLAAAIGGGAVDVAWVSPTLALTADELRDTVPIVSSVREGVSHYHGVLFVRRESPFTSPLALKGARAAWVAKTSGSGYVFPRVALAGHGVDPEHLFGEEIFLGSHGAVAQAVASGRCDVGATFAMFEGGKPSGKLVTAGFFEPDASWARVLLATPSIPSDLIVATRAIAAELGSTLPEALRALTAEVPASVSHVFNADALAPVDRRSLEELRRQLDDARSLGVI